MTYMPWISFKNGYTNCKKKNGTLSKVLPMQRPGNVESPMQTEHPAQKFRGVWAILNGKERKQSKGNPFDCDIIPKLNSNLQNYTFPQLYL